MVKVEFEIEILFPFFEANIYYLSGVQNLSDSDLTIANAGLLLDFEDVKQQNDVP